LKPFESAFYLVSAGAITASIPGATAPPRDTQSLPGMTGSWADFKNGSRIESRADGIQHVRTAMTAR
jgi:hypothetical protein